MTTWQDGCDLPSKCWLRQRYMQNVNSVCVQSKTSKRRDHNSLGDSWVVIRILLMYCYQMLLLQYGTRLFLYYYLLITWRGVGDDVTNTFDTSTGYIQSLSVHTNLATLALHSHALYYYYQHFLYKKKRKIYTKAFVKIAVLARKRASLVCRK